MRYGRPIDKGGATAWGTYSPIFMNRRPRSRSRRCSPGPDFASSASSRPGQASPPGFWYDQPQDEWVIVLRGAAGLLVEGEPEQRLGPGDFVFLPARKRHRVTWTGPDEPTVWLAVHFGEGV